MNNFKIYILGFFLVIFSLLPGAAQELWMQYGVSYEINKKMKASVDFQNRYLNTGDYNKYKNATKISLEYKLSKHFKLSGSYRYSKQFNHLNTEGGDELDDKQRYTIDLNAKLPLGKKYKIKNRSRYQISLVEFEDAKRYYRNKTTFELKIDKKTDFFVSKEYFFRLDKDKKPLGRMSIGLERELLGNFAIKPFFSIEKKKSERSVERTYIIGTSLYFNL